VAVVEAGRGVTLGRVDVIRNDDAIGTRQAVDHLVQLGHHAIAYVDGGLNPGADDRRDGYRAAMTDHGLSGHI
jgi:DNA-binding LacI/PurR family transcriptional regulator